MRFVSYGVSCRTFCAALLYAIGEASALLRMRVRRRGARVLRPHA